MAILKKLFGPMDGDEDEGEFEDEEVDQASDEDEEVGELAVDMYEEGDDLVVQSTIAGVKPEDLDITVASDILTIKGERKHEEERTGDDYIYQECFWGGFSRQLQLPYEVNVDQVEAEINDGILTLVLPKAGGSKTKKVKVKSE